MIIEHYAVFETKLKSEELNQNNWDILRTKSEEKAYAIEDSVEEYEENCRKAVSYENASKYIADILKKYHAQDVVSLGVGKGILEWHLKRQMPELFVECTDYAGQAVEKLEKVFIKGDSFREFDILNGDYRIFDKNAFFILYRVSAEFCFSDWCEIFKKMKECGIKNILYVPESLATKDIEIEAKEEHRRHVEQGIRDIFCGWIYSEDVLEEIFSAGNYKIEERIQIGMNLFLYLLR